MAGEQRTIGRIGSLLSIYGIVAGILYVLYVLHWSGERIARIDLQPRGGSEARPVALDPEMTPVRAVLGLDYSGRLGGRIARYDVAIGGDEDVRIKDIFHARGIANDPSDDSGRSVRVRSHHVDLGSFEVPFEAGYLLRAEISPSGRVDVADATVTLRANSAEWDFRIIGGLVAGLAIGFGLAVAGQNRDGQAG